MLSGFASAASEKVIYNFTGGADGALPMSQLVLDGAGNLYGTTSSGGIGIQACGNGCGMVFELVRSQSGWEKRVLYNFGSYDGDGTIPQVGVTFDAAGNLYGTTVAGGAYQEGTIFKLTPNAKGGWTETTIYNFQFDCCTGFPSALVVDAAGTLYGTIMQGVTGNCNHMGCGAVFELSPQMDGSWQETTIHGFQGAAENDGAWPQSGVLLDSAGNVYVATEYGGIPGCHSSEFNSGFPPTGCGGIYEFTNNSGTWTETTIYTFERGDGRAICPLGKPAFDHAGNLIGPSWLGGNGLGTFYDLSPGKNGAWQQTVLYRFFGDGNGARPLGNLTFDGQHRVYGVTTVIPAKQEAIVFELDQSVPLWKGKVLHTFGGGRDGLNPEAGMVMDRKGHLYGTTFQGGTGRGGVDCLEGPGCGTVYEVIP
jgi:uncharacterized repeat protein (TIGR03803 family)